MADTKEELCNLALSLIGNEATQISDFTSGTGPEARQCRLHYQRTLDEYVRKHSWNCGRTRVAPTQTVPSISDGTLTFTYDSTINDKASFVDSSPTKSIRWSTSNSRWEYGTWNGAAFSATDYNAGTGNVPPEDDWINISSGTAAAFSLTNSYGFGYGRAHLLPTDCVRPIYLTNTNSKYENNRIGLEWAVEGRTILSNFDTVYLLYIAEPSIANMDSLFIEGFVTYLAIKLAVPLAGVDTGTKLKGALWQEFNQVIMPEARRINGFEGDGAPIVDSEWLDATFSNSRVGSGWMSRSEGDIAI